MSTFCSLFIYSENKGVDIKKIITEEIACKSLLRVYDSLEEVLKNNTKDSELEISFDAFSIDSNFMNERNIDFKNAEYSVKINYQIYFRIHQDVENWERQMMIFIGAYNEKKFIPVT